MQIEIINKIFGILARKNKQPKTELEYNNNFTLLVAVVLSAQATDISVNKASRDLFLHYNSPQKMLDLGERALKNYIKTIGLYNAKAKNIIALSRVLVDKHNSIVPDDFAALIDLPGVGRKTANVVLNCAFGRPTIAVDTHVFRVAKRVGLANGNTPEKVERELLVNIPAKWLAHAHHWLILHGRYLCKARRPECGICSIKEYCEYYKERINEK